MSIPRFVRRLSAQGQLDQALNLYAGRSKAAVIRRANLLTYFEKMEGLGPGTLLLGEAPGYRGARLTGVPFTCEAILFSHPFFEDGAYKRIDKRAALETEQSANIVWEALSAEDEIPLIWNIFPHHPHLPEREQSNRAPNAAELQMGKAILEDLLEIFPIQRIGAVGRKAESMLGEIPLPSQYIRHPARGGKTKFIQGLHEFLSTGT